MRNNNTIKARQNLRYSYKKICAVKIRRTFQRFIERTQLKSWCKLPPYLPIRAEDMKNNVSN